MEPTSVTESDDPQRLATTDTQKQRAVNSVLEGANNAHGLLPRPLRRWTKTLKQHYKVAVLRHDNRTCLTCRPKDFSILCVPQTQVTQSTGV